MVEPETVVSIPSPAATTIPLPKVTEPDPVSPARVTQGVSISRLPIERAGRATVPLSTVSPPLNLAVPVISSAWVGVGVPIPIQPS